MKKILIILSLIGLMLTVIPSILVFNQQITVGLHYQLMFAGMILWFSTASFWMKEQKL